MAEPFNTNDWIVLGVTVIFFITIIMHILFGTQTRTGGGVKQYTGKFDAKYLFWQIVTFFIFVILMVLDFVGVYSNDDLVNAVKKLSEL